MAVQQCKLLLICLFTSSSLAEDAQDYLALAADTYSRLKSLQVETVTERRSADKRSPLKVIITLYTLPPSKIRIETKDDGNILRSLLISNGQAVTEYRAWQNQYTSTVAAALSVNFTPDRGTGLGEMLYSTIADSVSKASIRGRQTLQIGQDRIPCVVVDVEYSYRVAQFSFWIAEDKGLVLRRAVTFSDSNREIKTVVSTVRAMTINEDISDAIFEFDPPAGAKEVPLSEDTEPGLKH